MLFWPWSIEDEQLNDEKMSLEDMSALFKKNIPIISRNKVLFESQNTENYELEVQQVEADFELRFKQVFDQKVKHIQEADKRRLAVRQRIERGEEIGSEAGSDLEDIDEELGFETNAWGDVNTKENAQVQSLIDAQNHQNVNEQLSEETADDEWFYHLFAKLNAGQHTYMMNFIREMRLAYAHGVRKQRSKSDPDKWYENRPFHLIVGGSGTGKSFLIKLLTLWTNRFYKSLNAHHHQQQQQQSRSRAKEGFQSMSLIVNSNRVLLAAFTGKAAFNINGRTLHSAFHLQTKKRYVEKEIEVSIKYKEEFFNIELVIIDEVSMVSSEHFYNVEQMLRSCKDNTLPFGGVPVVFFGDFRQLPPIMAQLIFKPVINRLLKTLVDTSIRDESKKQQQQQQQQLARNSTDSPPSTSINASTIVSNVNTILAANNQTHLHRIMKTKDWWSLFKIYELKEIMRQRNDVPFALALNALGDDGLHGLSDQQVALFDNCIVQNEKHIPREAIFLFKTNKQRRAFNCDRINRLSGKLICNYAHDIMQGFLGDSLWPVDAIHRLKLYRARVNYFRQPDSCELDDDNLDMDMLQDKLNIKIGARYMIKSNEDIGNGLVNGACCTVVKVILKRYNVLRYVKKEKDENNNRLVDLFASPDEQEYVERENCCTQAINDKNCYGRLPGFVYEEDEPADSGIRQPYFCTKVTLVSRLWVDFNNATVGKNRREDFKQLYKDDELTADERKRCVPLMPHTMKIYERDGLTKKKVIQVDRTQFNLVECEALTVCKCQGDTYECVAVNIAENHSRNELYVALSRCTSSKGLHLYGRDTILKPEIEKMTRKERQLHVQAMHEKNDSLKELNRMRRDSPVHNEWPFLVTSASELDATLSMSLMFLNLASFKSHHAKLASDYGFVKADLILLCETRSYPDAVRQFYNNNSPLSAAGYSLAYVSGSKEHAPSNGQIWLVKTSKKDRLKLVAHNCHDQQAYLYKRTDCCEISLHTYQTDDEKEPYYICSVYKHPGMTHKDFYNEMKVFLTRHLQPTRVSCQPINFKQKLIIIGDFNNDYKLRDFNEHPDKGAREMCKKLPEKVGNMQMAFNVKCPTTNKNTLIDWCLYDPKIIDKKRVECQVYESYFTYHKPIWFSILKKN